MQGPTKLQQNQAIHQSSYNDVTISNYLGIVR